MEALLPNIEEQFLEAYIPEKLLIREFEETIPLVMLIQCSSQLIVCILNIRNKRDHLPTAVALSPMILVNIWFSSMIFEYTQLSYMICEEYWPLDRLSLVSLQYRYVTNHHLYIYILKSIFLIRTGTFCLVLINIGKQLN